MTRATPGTGPNIGRRTHIMEDALGTGVLGCMLPKTRLDGRFRVAAVLNVLLARTRDHGWEMCRSVAALRAGSATPFDPLGHSSTEE